MNHQWALITGASSGIGRALCDQFAADGINIVLVARDQAALKDTAAVLEKQYKIKTHTITADLSRPETAQRIYGTLQTMDIGLTYLVNNAGFGDYGSFATTDWEKEKGMIGLNITALTELCKLFLPVMLERGHGRILNLASTAAFLPGPRMAVYFATKAYVLHFSEAIGEELRGSGVTVTALCPGPTATHFASTANATKSAIFRGNLPTAKEVARFGYRAMQAGKPVAIHRGRNRLLLLLVRFMPRRAVTKFVGRAQAH